MRVPYLLLTAAAMAAAPASLAQTPGAVLVGSVNRAGTVFTAQTVNGPRRMTLYTTPQQAGVSRRAVILSRYAGKRVAVACLTAGASSAWNCTAIGEMRPTVAGRPRR